MLLGFTDSLESSLTQRVINKVNESCDCLPFSFENRFLGNLAAAAASSHPWANYSLTFACSASEC